MEGANLREIFDLCDEEKNGNIPVGRLKDMLRSQFGDNNEDVEKLVDSLDAAGNGLISFEEFSAGIQNFMKIDDKEDARRNDKEDANDGDDDDSGAEDTRDGDDEDGHEEQAPPHSPAVLLFPTDDEFTYGNSTDPNGIEFEFDDDDFLPRGPPRNGEHSLSTIEEGQSDLDTEKSDKSEISRSYDFGDSDPQLSNNENAASQTVSEENEREESSRRQAPSAEEQIPNSTTDNDPFGLLIDIGEQPALATTTLTPSTNPSPSTAKTAMDPFSEENFEDFGEIEGEDAKPQQLTESQTSMMLREFNGLARDGMQSSSSPKCRTCIQMQKYLDKYKHRWKFSELYKAISGPKRISSSARASQLYRASLASENWEPAPPIRRSSFETEDVHEAFEDAMAVELISKVNELESEVSRLREERSSIEAKNAYVQAENTSLAQKLNEAEEKLQEREAHYENLLSETKKYYEEQMSRRENSYSSETEKLQFKIHSYEEEIEELKESLSQLNQSMSEIKAESNIFLEKNSQLEVQYQQLAEDKSKVEEEYHAIVKELAGKEELISDLNKEMTELTEYKQDVEHQRNRTMSVKSDVFSREQELQIENQKLRAEVRQLENVRDELSAQLLTRGVEEGRSLLSQDTGQQSLAAELDQMSKDDMMLTLRKNEDTINRYREYVEKILVTIMENNPGILEIRRERSAVNASLLNHPNSSDASHQRY